jgi:hypothetical protein
MILPRFCATTLLALLTLALASPAAATPDTWIPARWPGGPLEVERRAKDGTLPDSAALRESLARWYDPATLDLLQGTPINCLLVTWSAGGDADTERAHQQLVSAYARAARSRGIAVLGLVHAPAFPASFLPAAVEAGLDGLVFEGDFPDVETLAAEARRALRTPTPHAVVVVPASPDTPAPAPDIVATTDAFAPGVRDVDDEMEAGPSSEPWIDFNLGLLRSLRAHAGARPVWLLHSLAARPSPLDYQRAIAEATAAGARWAVAPDDELRHGLWTNAPDAIDTWRRIAAHLAFQRDHTAWRNHEPLAVLGFVHDRDAAHRFLAGEHLKLALRARIPLTFIERAELNAPVLAGLGAVHALDLPQPTAAERALLTGFARKGGLLVVTPAWQPAEFSEHEDVVEVPLGDGRLAVCRDEADAGELAKVLVDLIGREQLGVRLFRAPSVLSHAARGAEGDVLVHLINYASYPAESLVVRVAGEFRKARWYTPGAPPEDASLESAPGRAEATIARLPVYGVLRLER